MVGRLSPSLPPLTTNNMNLSTMIHSSDRNYLQNQPLPSPPHPTQLPSVSTHATLNQPPPFRSNQSSLPFPSVSSITSHPLPKLPPLSSQLAPIPPVSQPLYREQPLAPLPPSQNYSNDLHATHQYPQSSLPQLSHCTQHQPSVQPPSLISTEPARLPISNRSTDYTNYPQSYNDTTSLVSRPQQRTSPLQLPLPPSKSVLSDPHPVFYDTATYPTVSPVSVTHRQPDAAYCVSPVSTSQPSDDGHAPHSALPSLAPTLDRIDDSLIARLRGFHGPNPPMGHGVVAISRDEPQIRDTSESLAIGYVDNVPPNVQGHLAPVNDAVSPDRPHACRKCSATFRRRDNLMAHIRAQHKGERPFKCEVCGFRFIKKDHAMKHWKVVHLKERPFVCTRCNSRFGQRSDLNKHVRSVHLRIKPFECEHCGLRFSHRGNQIRHQAVVHEKKKPFTCTECSSSFAEKSNLLKHCQAVHKIGATFSS